MTAAERALGKPQSIEEETFGPLDTLIQAPESILQEAQRVVLGPRQAAYGHPIDNHSTTATMWTAYLGRKYGACFALSPEDVCWLNVLQKVSREANSAKRDNAVDVCGYAANVEMIQNERVRRNKTLGL